MVSTRLRVKELLRERRWTTKVLAEKTGMSESYLTHIKNGTRRWNEDALTKLARAFEIHPTDLFYYQKESADIDSKVTLPDISQIAELSEKIDLNVQVVPVLDQIPANPTATNNRILQVAAGFKDKYVPVVGSDDEAMFCLHVDDSLMSPRFVKGDYLIISPSVWTRSGDVVAVEYDQDDEKKRAIMQINYMDEFVVLESVNHKQAPIALVRGKDSFRIIGKVVSRYQKMG